MLWSRLACQFAVLTVLVLHATCLEAHSWGDRQVTEHAINNDAAVFQHAAEQALQNSLDQALQSLMPDAAAAAVLFSTAEPHQLAGNDYAAGTAAAAPEAQPAAAPSTASEVIPMRTTHRLALPSKHRLQLQQNVPEAKDSLQEAENNSAFTAPYDEPQNELQEDYVYLQDQPPRIHFLQNEEDYQYTDAAANADVEAKQAPLPPQLPEDAPSSSSSDDVAAANPGMLTLQGDVMVSSRMPFSSALLQQSFTQPLVELAADAARDVWQALARVETAASLAQLQHARPVQIQEVEVTVESGSSSSSSDLASADSAFDSAITTSSSSSSGNDAMEISVIVESSRPRPLLSFLRAAALNRKQALLQDGLDAAAIAAAVVRALGRWGASEQQQQQAEPVAQQQQVQQMLAELRATGTYEGEVQGGSKQLPATTAAAVAAAVSAVSAAAQPWHSMQMELQVTHTIQNTPFTWVHVTLLVLAIIFSNIGLFLLAPWVAKLLGDDEASEHDDDSSSSDEKQAQFISAGLAEAGLYKKLLPEGDAA